MRNKKAKGIKRLIYKDLSRKSDEVKKQQTMSDGSIRNTGLRGLYQIAKKRYNKNKGV